MSNQQPESSFVQSVEAALRQLGIDVHMQSNSYDPIVIVPVPEEVTSTNSEGTLTATLTLSVVGGVIQRKTDTLSAQMHLFKINYISGVPQFTNVDAWSAEFPWSASLDFNARTASQAVTITTNSVAAPIEMAVLAAVSGNINGQAKSYPKQIQQFRII